MRSTPDARALSRAAVTSVELPVGTEPAAISTIWVVLSKPFPAPPVSEPKARDAAARAAGTEGVPPVPVGRTTPRASVANCSASAALPIIIQGMPTDWVVALPSNISETAIRP